MPAGVSGTTEGLLICSDQEHTEQCPEKRKESEELNGNKGNDGLRGRSYSHWA